MSTINFTVEMANLKKHANFVQAGLGASKTDLPVLLVRFDVFPDRAVMFTSNKEMFCRTTMKLSQAADAETKEGSFSILGSKLARLISQVAAETLSFSFDGESVTISAGFLTVNLETYDGASLKTVENGVQEHLTLEGLTVNRAAFEEALKCAKSCTTTNSIRPDVTHVELRGGRMLSSDGRKILIYSYDGFPEAMGFKCPAAALSNMISAVSNAEATDLQVIEGGNYYFLKANKNQFTCGIRKIERTFPAIEKQIKLTEAPTDEISIDQNVLESMLRGVQLGLPTDEVKVILEVGNSDTEAYLEISALNSLGKRSHERASAGRTKKEIGNLSFPVSSKHLLDTLAVFKGDSVVDLLVLQGKSILMVKDTTDNREVQTLIPFRTDAQVEAEKKEREAEAEARKKEAPKVEVDTGGDLTAGAAAPTGDVDIE